MSARDFGLTAGNSSSVFASRGFGLGLARGLAGPGADGIACGPARTGSGAYSGGPGAPAGFGGAPYGSTREIKEAAG